MSVNSNNIYTAYYDIKNFVDQSNNYTVTPMYLSEYPNATNLLCANTNRMTNIITIPNKQMLYESYTISSFTDNTLVNKLGEITFTCFYADTGSETISGKSVQKMNVLGSTGIYSNINEVIIDFTTFPIRTIKFNIVVL
jgi:hypothetical protein